MFSVAFFRCAGALVRVDLCGFGLSAPLNEWMNEQAQCILETCLLWPIHAKLHEQATPITMTMIMIMITMINKATWHFPRPFKSWSLGGLCWAWKHKPPIDSTRCARCPARWGGAIVRWCMVVVVRGLGGSFRGALAGHCASTDTCTKEREFITAKDHSKRP